MVFSILKVGSEHFGRQFVPTRTNVGISEGIG